jgi:membrane protein implicated in regulation of membrane protease activity
MLPGTFLYVSLGAVATSAAQLRGARAGLIPLVVGLAATIAVVVLLTVIARRALRNTLRQPEAAT